VLLELQLRLSGCLLILIALAHVLFPRLFGWREELPRLSLINRQLMKVHTFFIALTVFLIGVLCLSSARELIATALGRRVAGGLALFWFVRLLVQFFGYSSELWQGKRRETIIHRVFTVVWLYLALLFLVTALSAPVSSS